MALGESKMLAGQILESKEATIFLFMNPMKWLIDLLSMSEPYCGTMAAEMAQKTVK